MQSANPLMNNLRGSVRYSARPTARASDRSYRSATCPMARSWLYLRFCAAACSWFCAATAARSWFCLAACAAARSWLLLGGVRGSSLVALAWRRARQLARGSCLAACAAARSWFCLACAVARSWFCLRGVRSWICLAACARGSAKSSVIAVASLSSCALAVCDAANWTSFPSDAPAPTFGVCALLRCMRERTSNANPRGRKISNPRALPTTTPPSKAQTSAKYSRTSPFSA